MGMIYHNSMRGFTLLIAVIFVSVVLAFSVALGSLGYKQSVLSSATQESNTAFYVADAALECALYTDEQGHAFSQAACDSNDNVIYNNQTATPSNAIASPPPITCDGSNPISATGFLNSNTGKCSTSSGTYGATETLSLDNGTHCAIVNVSKQLNGSHNLIFATGYDVSCATVTNGSNPRFVAQGLKAEN